MKRIFLLFIGLMLLLPWKGFAQNTKRYERLSTASGLSQSSVYKIIQDKKGFLWFATGDGLNRYDGHNFKIYRNDPSDPHSLSSSDVSSVLEDEDGNLWVGTRNSGLNKLNTRTGEIIRITRGPKGEDLSNLNIPSMVYLGNHSIGVAASGLGYLVLNTQTNRVQAKDSEIQNPLTKEITRLFKHSNGSIWFGTRYGKLISMQGKNLIPFQLVGTTTNLSYRVRSLFEASNGDILIGTDGRGLFRFSPVNQQFSSIFYQASAPLARQNIVSSMTKDARNNFWIGTDNGVYVAEGENFSRVKHIPSNPDPDLGLSSFSVMSLFTDSNANTWIGTWEAGLNISFNQKPRFAVLRYKPNTNVGLLSNKVTAIASMGDEGAWIGSNIGLSFFDHHTNTIKHWVAKTSTNSLNANGEYDVNFLSADANKGVWVGFWGKGINYFSAKHRLTDYPFIPGRREANFICIQPFQGKYLLGSAGLGVLEFDPATKKYRVPFAELGVRNFQNRSISSIAVVQNRQLWIGTIGFGLYMYDVPTGKLTHFVKSNGANSLSYNHISYVYQDKKQRVWVLTNGGGLNLYRPDKNGFQVFTVKDGLLSNTVRGLVEDKHGDLWLSTNGGISKMDGKTLRFVNFEEADGLQGKEFMTNAFAKNDKDWLFFGGVNGLNYLKSDSLRMRLDVPQVYFTDLKIFNKHVEVGEKDSPISSEISLAKEITLQPFQSVFSLDFVALEYQRPKNNRYAYYLAGFEKEWNYVGTQRTATYTNLSPGEYVFKVKASNSDGVWSESPKELRIIVLPPWYMTWWAYSLYVLILAGIIYGFVREIKIREAFKTDLRLKEIEKERIRELEQVKTHFFTNISHELRTPLTLIISPIEKYFLKSKQITAEQSVRVNSIYQNAQKLLRLINQLLDLSKIEAGKQHPIIAKHDLIAQLDGIIQGFKSYAKQKQIKLKWAPPVAGAWVYYDADIIEKCVSNLLSNAFKHTPEDGSIGVSVQLDRVFDDGQERITAVEIHVLDTGKGISEEHLHHIFDRFYQIPETMNIVGTGVGLSLCKELMTLHRGGVHVKSTLGAGSDFCLQFPVQLEDFEAAWLQETWQIIPQKPVIIPRSPRIEQEKQILLIVDDHEELRAFVADIFGKQFQVLQAARGEEAMEMALTYLPDLIITDWMMPGMSGVNLCRALRQNTKTSHIPLVLLTSKGSQESQIEGMQSGADDFISKPFNADLLEIRVNKLLEVKERLRESWQKQMIHADLTVGKLPTFADEFLVKATSFILSNITNAEFDVEDLEQGMDMSKMQLYRKLKSLTSLAGNEFIRSIRLQQAKILLETADFNIAEVAYQVGFNDPAYFTRAFKKQYGKTPKSFLK